MKAKPIEPGCLALLINAAAWYRDEIGVNPVRVVQALPPDHEGKLWQIDCGGLIMRENEQYLLRVDDSSIESQLKQEREREHA